MQLRHIAAVGLLGFTMVVGCTHRNLSSAPADAQTVQQIRESYTKVDPNARVGLVIAIRPENALAAIGDIPVNDFNEGDVLVLMDSKQNIIGAGTVVAKTNDALHVHYDVRADGRAPQVGDLAVRAK